MENHRCSGPCVDCPMAYRPPSMRLLRGLVMLYIYDHLVKGIYKTFTQTYWKSFFVYVSSEINPAFAGLRVRNKDKDHSS